MVNYKLSMCFFIIIFVSIFGCASRGIKKPTATEIDRIENIQLYFMHNKNPERYFSGERQLTPSGHIIKRFGMTHWSEEKYISEVNIIAEKLFDAISSELSNDQVIAYRIAQSFNSEENKNSKNIRIIEEEKISQDDKNKTQDFPLSLHKLDCILSYRTTITGSFSPDRIGYAIMETGIYDNENNLIYKNSFFSERWNLDNSFRPESFGIKLMDFVSDVGKKVRIDLAN